MTNPTKLEFHLVKDYVVPNSVIFDVGVLRGRWTDMVLLENPSKVHMFIPLFEYYQKLLQKYKVMIEKKKIFISNCAISNTKEMKKFYHYSKHPNLSTLYRRSKAEKKYKFGPPDTTLLVSTTTIDEYCARKKIDHIDFLKIDVEGAELDVLVGAKHLIKEGKIDYIEFEYGGAFLDAGITLEQVYSFLTEAEYKIYKLTDKGCEFVESVEKYENFVWSIFFAISSKKEVVNEC